MLIPEYHLQGKAGTNKVSKQITNLTIFIKHSQKYYTTLILAINARQWRQKYNSCGMTKHKYLEFLKYSPYHMCFSE